jgi:F-type H+-transporting ATPase subunit alpha
VGGAAQVKTMKKVAGRLRLDLAQYRELAAFAQFSSDLDDTTKAQVERGKRLTELLKQPQFGPLPVDEQIALIYAGTNGLLDPLAPEKIAAFVVFAREELRATQAELLGQLTGADGLTEELEATLKAALEQLVAKFETI